MYEDGTFAGTGDEDGSDSESAWTVSDEYNVDMPGSTYDDAEDFGETVETEDGYSPGGTGTGAAGAGGHGDGDFFESVEWAVDGTADTAGDFYEDAAGAAEDAVDAASPEWLDWMFNHQEEVLAAGALFVLLFLVRPYASAGEAVAT